MSIKVRRGLGLLVVAVIAFVIAFVAGGTDAGSGFVGDWVVPLAFVIGVIGGAVLLLAGLVLVAWGLLRD